MIDTSSTICLSSPDIIEDDTLFGYGITGLISVNLLAIILASIVMFLETFFKAQYHRMKNKLAKLVLTRNFLEKLRPKQKVTIPSAINNLDLNQMSCSELASVPRKQMFVPNDLSKKVDHTPNEDKTLLQTFSEAGKSKEADSKFAKKNEKSNKEKPAEKAKETSKPATKNAK